MNNKEIKFDILENADLEKIEQIGINENMLDDDAKNRMFSYAQDKYKKLSGKNTTEKQNDSKEYVCGVEKADKRKTSRILMTVCSVAASFALIFGITVILKGNLSKPPVTPDPLDTTATTVVTTDMTVKTSETTGKTTETTVTTEELSNFNNYDSQILERETERVLKEFTGRTDEVFTDIQYAQADLNGDAVPELVITGLPFSGDYRSFLYFFNGSEYVQSDEKLNTVKYIADSKLLITYGKNQRYALFEVSSDNQLTVIEDLTKDNAEHYYDAVDEFCRKYELDALEYTNYHWQEFSYTFYAESNEAYVENPLELTTNIDLKSLASQGIIPADSDGEYYVCVNYIAENPENNLGKEVSGNKYPADYSEQISETVGFNYRRKERMGIVLVDDKNGLDYTDLCVADIDYKTGEINIISDKTNGAASFSFKADENEE